MLVLRAVGNSSAEVVGKAGPADLSQVRDVSSAAKPIGSANEVGKQGNYPRAALTGQKQYTSVDGIHVQLAVVPLDGVVVPY